MADRPALSPDDPVGARGRRWRRRPRRPIRRLPLTAVFVVAAATGVVSATLGADLHPRVGLRDAGTATPTAVSAAAGTPGDPALRERAAMSYDPATHTVVIFGGDDGTTAYDDTWSWDGSQWSQLHPAISPPPLTGGSLGGAAHILANQNKRIASEHRFHSCGRYGFLRPW